jgi:beta-lactam-binding protein with PASTA domain
MTQPPEDTWPTPEEPTIVEHETLVAAPPPPPLPPRDVLPPDEPDRRIGWGMLLALGVVALIVLGAILAWVLTHRSNDNDTTTVVTTQPAQTVTTTPTTATAGIAVPNVQGQTLKDARTTLTSAGLKPAITKVTSAKPAGTVVDQAPDAGAKIAKGSTVTLSVSQPPQTQTQTQTTTSTPTTTAATTTPAQPTTSTVPDVSGQTTQAAAQALNQAGLLASLVFVPSDQPLGTVVQQAKQSGTIVPFHSHVQINLSRGTSENPDQTVPNVIGRTLDQAVSAMQGANLRLIFLKSAVTSRTQTGKIVQQSPLGGGKAPRNGQVLVYLGALKAQ